MCRFLKSTTSSNSFLLAHGFRRDVGYSTAISSIRASEPRMCSLSPYTRPFPFTVRALSPSLFRLLARRSLTASLLLSILDCCTAMQFLIVNCRSCFHVASGTNPSCRVLYVNAGRRKLKVSRRAGCCKCHAFQFLRKLDTVDTPYQSCLNSLYAHA